MAFALTLMAPLVAKADGVPVYDIGTTCAAFDAKDSISGFDLCMAAEGAALARTAPVWDRVPQAARFCEDEPGHELPVESYVRLLDCVENVLVELGLPSLLTAE